MRFQYQKTNAALNRKTAISKSATGTPRPPGKLKRFANSRFLVVRDTTKRSLVFANAGNSAGAGIGTERATLAILATLGGLPSGKDPTETCAAVRIPLNLPAHPRQYFARSLFAVWQDSQNFVMAMTRKPEVHGTGISAVITTSKLITTEKAAKSITDAHSGIPRASQGNDSSGRTLVPSLAV